MEFDVNNTIEILEKTPAVLENLLGDLSDRWLTANEGPETFSPFDVVGHLIHGEKTDWVPRMELILSDKPDKTFQPFDRFAQFAESEGKTLPQLLAEFRTLREHNLETLKSKQLTAADLAKTGIHPTFGAVTLEQLLATWTVHDLGHLAQIARVMSKQYKDAVGPWVDFLPILTR